MQFGNSANLYPFPGLFLFDTMCKCRVVLYGHKRKRNGLPSRTPGTKPKGNNSDRQKRAEGISNRRQMKVKINPKRR